jgi:PilZ domain
MSLTWEQNPPVTGLVLVPTTILEIDMPTQQERRDSERVPCMRAYPYELTKPVDSSTVKLTEGSGYSINRSVGGMLLLLPEEVDQRQVLEIQVPSEARKEQITKLGEVCWTRPIPVSARVNMYLVGIRFLFELPTLGQSPQTH